MAINETLTGQSESSVDQVLNSNSIAHVSGDFKGKVELKVAPSGSSNYLTVWSIKEPKAVPLVTPDSTADYKYVVDLESGSANVYLGA